MTESGSNTYQVVAGSDVSLKWNTTDADTVTLVGVGDQPPSGSYTISDVVVDQVFQLKASNDNGDVEEFITLVVTAKPAPPAPGSISGTVNGSDIAITWDYSNENEIVGFRLYRATDPGGPYVRVADETQLANSTRQYIDSGPLPTCTAYYLTAVYQDPASGNKQETSSSANSWFSSGCP